MDADSIANELKALGLDNPSVRLGDSHGYFWASISTMEPNGQTHTYSVRIEREATPLHIQIGAAQLKAQIQDE